MNKSLFFVSTFLLSFNLFAQIEVPKLGCNEKIEGLEIVLSPGTETLILNAESFAVLMAKNNNPNVAADFYYNVDQTLRVQIENGTGSYQEVLKDISDLEINGLEYNQSASTSDAKDHSFSFVFNTEFLEETRPVSVMIDVICNNQSGSNAGAGETRKDSYFRDISLTKIQSLKKGNVRR